MNIDAAVKLYIKKRDELDALEAAHKEQVAAIKADMQLIEGGLMKLMEEQGVRQFKSAHGTAFQKEWTRAKVADWESTLQFILQNERYDLLNRAVNKTVALEVGNVPGVEVTRGFEVQIRRS